MSQIYLPGKRRRHKRPFFGPVDRENTLGLGRGWRLRGACRAISAMQLMSAVKVRAVVVSHVGKAPKVSKFETGNYERAQDPCASKPQSPFRVSMLVLVRSLSFGKRQLSKGTQFEHIDFARRCHRQIRS